MGDFKNQRSGEQTQATSIKRVSTLSDNKKYKLRSFLDSDSNLSIEDVIKKGLKHPKELLIATLVFFIGFYIFRPSGTQGIYQQTSAAVFSSADNNSLFRSLDTLVPAGDDGRVSDDLNAYAEKAITLLKSNDFIDHCAEAAVKDSQVASAFFPKEYKKLNANEIKEKIRDFLRNKIEISTPDKKSLIAFKNTKGGFTVKFKSYYENDLRGQVSTVSRLMSEFLAKKDLEDIQSARTLVQDRLVLAQKDFDAASLKRNQVANEVPNIDPWSISNLLTQVASTRTALASNRALKKHIEKKVSDIQQKIQVLNNKKNFSDNSGDVSVQTLKNEVATLYNLKSTLIEQGFSNESIAMRRVDDNLERVTKALESKKITGDVESNVDSPDTGGGSARFSQSIEVLDADNVFYETKLDQLKKDLAEMNQKLGKKVMLDSEIKSLDNLLFLSQKKIESLKNGLARLDVSDFKALRRITFVFSPVSFTQSFSVFSYLLIVGIFSIILGFIVSLAFELRNPSLTQIKSFEEIGLRVLGGLPSYRNPLLNDLDEKYHFYFSKCGIGLENTLNFLKSKIVLFSSVDDCMQSATVSLNLGIYLSNTGRKILILETDLVHNSLVSLTGAPLDGGISELSFHEGEVNISPFQFQKGLDILTGNPDRMPREYRLASQEFFNLLGELKEQYDFIFIHARSCLEGSDAADLSRYAGLSVVTCDARTIKIDLLEKFVGEMQGFLSKESMFILDEPEDLLKVGQGDVSKAKVSPASLRKNTEPEKTKIAA
jgi:hypothetical protein